MEDNFDKQYFAIVRSGVHSLLEIKALMEGIVKLTKITYSIFNHLIQFQIQCIIFCFPKQHKSKRKCNWQAQACPVANSTGA